MVAFLWRSNIQVGDFNFRLTKGLRQLIVINAVSVNIIGLGGNVSMSSLQHLYQIISIRPALLWSIYATTEGRDSNWYSSHYTHVEYFP